MGCFWILLTFSKNISLEYNPWQSNSFEYLTPEIRYKGDLMKVYIWNPNHCQMRIDNFRIEAFELAKLD